MALFGWISLIVSLVSVLIYLYVSRIAEPVLVSTPFGQLKGFRAAARSGRLYNAFHAIPYAQPPVGERRFKAPEEYGKWNGVRDATVEVPFCLQAGYLFFRQFMGQEDCLILNVYTPQLPAKGAGADNKAGLLPVMVFIHGGHFMAGTSALYGPQYFMDEDVVLVTVNYRLGALGFLNTGDDVVSGNMGLKDQVLALKWVQAAIKDFGGDKDLVTIFGVSAGGASVDYLTLSPLSKNLFHRAIPQSGSSLCPWALSTNTKMAAQKLAKQLSCPTQPSEKMVKCLKSVDGHKMIESHQEIFDPLHTPESIFGPSVENVNDKRSAFLTELPSKILKEGRQSSKVPRMAGLTSEEGCYRTAAIIDSDRANQLQVNWTRLAPNLFVYDKKHVEAAPKILKHYFGVDKLTPDTPPLFDRDNYVQFTKAVGERFFFKCTKDGALAHAPVAPTYFYWLAYQSSSFGCGHALAASYNGNEYLPPLVNIGIAYMKKAVYDLIGWETFSYGVCHLDDLLYLFNLNLILAISTSSPDYEMSRAIVKTWVKFAKHGNPGKFKGVKWAQLNPKDAVPSFMKLDTSPDMIKEPFAAGSKFWDSLNLFAN